MRNRVACLLLLGALPVNAWPAGGHYPVDDAAIADPGHLQVETWLTRIDGKNQEFALLPAFTPRGSRPELTAGFFCIEENGEDFNRLEPALKWQIAPVEPGRLGAAVAIEGRWEDQDDRFVDWLVNFPVTYALPQAPLLLHFNLGYLRERAEGCNDRVFLGAAFEWSPGTSFDVIGQAYREGADADPEAQIALRFGLGGHFEHLDIALGRQLQGERDGFVTAGVALVF